MTVPETCRIAVLDDYQGVALTSADWSPLPPGCTVDVAREHLVGEDLVAFLADARAVVVMRERTPVDAALLDRLPALELVVTTGMRNAAIDLGAAAERGVTVCGTGGLAGPATELTWALILACLRRIPEEVAAMRDGAWQTTLGQELEGRTLGLLGLGHIGQRMARVAHAFDMRVTAWSPNLTPERATAAGAELVGKRALFATADVVSVHLKLGDRSRGLVGVEELRAMRPDAWLVNTSRGPIVDEAALLTAVREGWIAGAALDVYDEEPLPAGHPFRDTPGILATGHIGYVTAGNYRSFYTDAVEDLAAFLAGDPVRRLA